MPIDLADDAYSGLELGLELDEDAYSSVELPESGAKVMWAGRPVTREAIDRAASSNGVSPEAILRLGTRAGQFEAGLAETAVGATALRMSEGLQSTADTVVAAGARAVASAQDIFGIDSEAADNVVRTIHDNKRKRAEFLKLIEREGAVTDVIGERGARVYNQTIQSLAEIGSVGTALGATSVYSYIVGSAWEKGLSEGERAGLYGSELIGHAGRSALIEGATTYLMGRAAKKLGLESLEESLSPAARNQITRFLQSSARDKMIKAAKELGGWGAEGLEEMLISGAQQLNEMDAGIRNGFSWEQLLEAGASGVFGRGASGAVRAVASELRGLERDMPEIVAGVHAAETDLARGLNPFEVMTEADAGKLAKQTGRKSMTEKESESYRSALQFYTEEMRRAGKTGSLRQLEKEVRRLREEERQEAARQEQRPGREGESKVLTEPVVPKPSETADDRAMFSLAEFEKRIRPQPKADPAVRAEPKPNPYILAPWESETRAQRRIRFLSRDLARQKEITAQLRADTLAKRRLTREQINDALRVVQDTIPKDEQWKFMQGIVNATAPAKQKRLLDRLVKAVDRRERNLAVGMVREAFSKAGNLRKEFADQVDSLRAVTDLKGFRHKEVAEQLRNLAQSDPSIHLPEAAKELIDRLDKQNVNDMSVDDMLNLAATVESLTYQSAAADRLIGERESQELAAVSGVVVGETAARPKREMRSDSLVQQVRANLKGRPFDPSLTQERTLGSQAFHELAERPEITLKLLSPELDNQLYGKIRAARGRYKLRKATTHQLLSDTFNQLGLSHKSSLMQSIAHRLGRPGTELENWRRQERTVANTRLTRGEALQVVLSSKDPQALRNLQDGGVQLEAGKRSLPPVTDAMLNDMRAFIGPEGEMIADVMFEHLNTYIIDGVNEANLKLTGRVLTDKTDVVPIVRAEEEHNRLISAGRSYNGMQQSLADSYGHLKRRSDKLSALRIPEGMDAIDMFVTHTNRMHRFAEYAVPARNAELILNEPQIKQSILNNNGEQGYNHILDAVRSEVAGIGTTDKIATQIASINHAVAGAIIGGRLSVMMAQPLDTIVAAAYDEGGVLDLMSGLNGEMARRGPVAVLQEMKQVLGRNSGEWNGRYEEGSYAGEVTSGIYKRTSHFRPATLVDHAADPLMKSELALVAVPNYLAAKAAARRKLGIDENDFGTFEDNPEWTDLVVRTWEQKMVRGSNSSDPMELSSTLRYAKKNPIAGLVTNFYNTAGKVYSLFSMAEGKLVEGDMSGAAKFAMAGLASTVLFAALQTALTQSGKEKDHPPSKRLLARAVKNIVGLHPLGGQLVADQVIGPALGLPQYGDNPILLAEAAVETVRGAGELAALLGTEIQNTDDLEKLNKTLMDFGRSAGPLMAVPTPAAIDIIQRIKKGTAFPGLKPKERDVSAPSI